MVRESQLQFAPIVVEQALLQLLDSRNTAGWNKLEKRKRKRNMLPIKILPPSSFDWHISIWHNDQDHKCSYQSTILYWGRLLVSHTAAHIENRRTNQIAKMKRNELLRWENSEVEAKYINQIWISHFYNISIKLRVFNYLFELQFTRGGAEGLFYLHIREPYMCF